MTIKREGAIFEDQIESREKIDKALSRAVRAALLDHKQAGNPVAAWQDGKVVLVAPEDIVIPPDPDAESPDPATPPALARNEQVGALLAAPKDGGLGT